MMTILIKDRLSRPRLCPAMSLLSYFAAVAVGFSLAGCSLNDPDPGPFSSLSREQIHAAGAGVDIFVPVTPPPGIDAESNADDFTGTNVQEASVDELDIVKTDGKFIYTTRGNALEVIGSYAY